MIKIKDYLKWISTTFKNLKEYDVCFKKGREYLISQGLKYSIFNDMTQDNYALLYITPYLIINAYEFFSLFWKEQYDSDKPISLNQLKESLKNKFDIDFDSEDPALIKEIRDCDLFKECKPKQQSVNDLPNTHPYNILHKARQSIAHADFYKAGKSYIEGFNGFNKIIGYIDQIIKD